jgi:hypothetical protein
MESRDQSIQKIRALSVRLVDLAGLADVAPGRVTEFVRNRRLPPHQVERIQKAINDVERLYAALHPFRVDTRDARLFREALRAFDEGRLMVQQ